MTIVGSISLVAVSVLGVAVFGLVVARNKRLFFPEVYGRRDAAFGSRFNMSHESVRLLVEKEPHICSRITLAHHLYREIDEWVGSAQFEAFQVFLSLLLLLGFAGFFGLRSGASFLAALPYYFTVSSIASVGYSAAKGFALWQSARRCERDCNFIDV